MNQGLCYPDSYFQSLGINVAPGMDDQLNLALSENEVFFGRTGWFHQRVPANMGAWVSPYSGNDEHQLYASYCFRKNDAALLPETLLHETARGEQFYDYANSRFLRVLIGRIYEVLKTSNARLLVIDEGSKDSPAGPEGVIALFQALDAELGQEYALGCNFFDGGGTPAEPISPMGVKLNQYCHFFLIENAQPHRSFISLRRMAERWSTVSNRTALLNVTKAGKSAKEWDFTLAFLQLFVLPNPTLYYSVCLVPGQQVNWGQAEWDAWERLGEPKSQTYQQGEWWLRNYENGILALHPPSLTVQFAPIQVQAALQPVVGGQG